MTLNEALNLIAKSEGYDSWSLLQSHSNQILPKNIDELFHYIKPGDITLIGARPGQGKTSFSLFLFVKAINEKKSINYLFTLSEIQKDIAGRIASYDESIGINNPHMKIDYSNDICADYIIRKTEKEIDENSLIVIDYLQMLDEKRENDTLQMQVEKLKDYAKIKRCKIIFISQIRREINYKDNKRPTEEDVRLPNPLDTSLFNKLIFLYREDNKSLDIEVILPKDNNHSFMVKFRDKNFSDTKQIDTDVIWYNKFSPFLNNWFNSYSEAKIFHENHGGYLLTFKKQFFVVTDEYVKYIGIDPTHKCWKDISFDVTKIENIENFLKEAKL